MASGLASLVGGYASDSENSEGRDDGFENASKGVEQAKGNDEKIKADQQKNDDDDDDYEVEDEEKSSGGDEGSGEGSSEEDVEDEDGDNDDDGNDASLRQKTSATSTASSSLLPSVDDLFNSTAGPDFLAAPGAGQDFVVEAMKKTITPTPSSSSTTADRSDVTRVDNKRVREAGAQGGGGAGVLCGGGLPSGVVKKPRGGAVGPTGPPSEKGKKKGVAREKISAKDKVKGQRLKGQSGIGSDFRTWKSDLEMTMRQQYD